MAVAPVEVGRAGLERAPGCGELGAYEHPPVEAAAPVDRVGMRGHDREAAQDGRPFLEAEHPRNERPARGGRRVDVVEAEGAGQARGDVPPPSSTRRLLDADDVRVEGAKLPHHHGQALLEMLVAASELRRHAAVEEVDGDDPERARRRAGAGRDHQAREQQEGERGRGDGEHVPPSLARLIPLFR